LVFLHLGIGGFHPCNEPRDPVALRRGAAGPGGGGEQQDHEEEKDSREGPLAGAGMKGGAGHAFFPVSSPTAYRWPLHASARLTNSNTGCMNRQKRLYYDNVLWKRRTAKKKMAEPSRARPASWGQSTSAPTP